MRNRANLCQKNVHAWSRNVNNLHTLSFKADFVLEIWLKIWKRKTIEVKNWIKKIFVKVLYHTALAQIGVLTCVETFEKNWQKLCKKNITFEKYKKKSKNTSVLRFICFLIYIALITPNGAVDAMSDMILCPKFVLKFTPKLWLSLESIHRLEHTKKTLIWNWCIKPID